MAGSLVIGTLSDGTNSTSSTNAILGSAKAWVNFNGTNGSIRANYNVQSVTRSASGTYTITFTTAMPDANYSVSGTIYMTGNTSTMGVCGGTGYSFTASAVTLFARSTAALVDPDIVCVAINR